MQLLEHPQFIGPCIILIVELRETNLMSLALLFHYLMPNMFRVLMHPSSGACDILLSYYMGCIALVRYVCGSFGVVGLECYPYAG